MLLKWATFVVIVVCCFVSTRAVAATKTAASCSSTDVQNAINAAVTGDTVTIPGGTCSWTSTVTVSKGITLQGAGQGQTVINDNVPKGNGTNNCTGGPLVNWSVNAPDAFRMTAMTIVGVAPDPDVCAKGHIKITGSTHSMRIDHVTINPAQTVSIYIDGDIWGVIDHFTHVGGFVTGVRIEHLNWNGTSGDDWGDRSWATPIHYGSSEGVYIEDSSFTGTSGVASAAATDCYAGGRFVFRHNTVDTLDIGSHGADSDQRHRACRWMEIYNNTFTYSTVNALGFIAWIRGGSGVFYNNTITAAGFSNKIVQVVNCRDANAGCGGGPNYTPWGACDGTSAYDQNSAGGYRCVDQPGSGTSNLLGPDTGGGITPANKWVGNISDPIYVWNNTLNGAANNTTVGSTNVAVNRDYFVGTARPGYTAFTYPHPLTGGAPSGGTAPAAPSALKTVAN